MLETCFDCEWPADCRRRDVCHFVHGDQEAEARRQVAAPLAVVPEKPKQTRGLCQPCTDKFWRYTGWRIRNGPAAGGPLLVTDLTTVSLCRSCDAGWFGKLLRREGSHAPPTQA